MLKGVKAIIDYYVSGFEYLIPSKPLPWLRCTGLFHLKYIIERKYGQEFYIPRCDI